MTQEQIMRILPHFRFQGAFQSMEELKSGNVNHTYRLVYDDNGTRHDYVLQRINTYAFREPARMMENIAGVTDHLRRALIKNGESPDRRVLEVIRTADGQPLYIEGENVWRAYVFIIDQAIGMVHVAAFQLLHGLKCALKAKMRQDPQYFVLFHGIFLIRGSRGG